MSRETSEWLNTNILVGFTDKRGFAWHYRLESQGAEGNHYPGAIPVDDVNRRLFDFTVDERPIYILSDTGYTEVEDRKAMVTSDDETVLGIFKGGYQGHAYSEWLLDTVATILDDELAIGSAGLLRNRAQAFVQIEMPESITTPEGVEFRPNLLAATSFDGSLSTTFKRTIGIAVCDNTMDAALAEAGQQLKVKHTRYSDAKIKDAREALAIVHTMSDAFSADVAALCAEKVDDSKFRAVLDVIVPVPDDEGRGKTMAETKQAEILSLYRSDARVAPWKGTAYGVVQAFNTWATHSASVRKGVSRYERNMEKVLAGKFATGDALVRSTLAAV